MSDLLELVNLNNTKASQHRVRDILRKWKWEPVKSSGVRRWRRVVGAGSFPPISDEGVVLNMDVERAKRLGFEILPDDTGSSIE